MMSGLWVQSRKATRSSCNDLQKSSIVRLVPVPHVFQGTSCISRMPNMYLGKFPCPDGVIFGSGFCSSVFKLLIVRRSPSGCFIALFTVFCNSELRDRIVVVRRSLKAKTLVRPQVPQQFSLVSKDQELSSF